VVDSFVEIAVLVLVVHQVQLHWVPDRVDGVLRALGAVGAPMQMVLGEGVAKAGQVALADLGQGAGFERHRHCVTVIGGGHLARDHIVIVEAHGKQVLLVPAAEAVHVDGGLPDAATEVGEKGRPVGHGCVVPSQSLVAGDRCVPGGKTNAVRFFQQHTQHQQHCETGTAGTIFAFHDSVQISCAVSR